MGQKDSGTKNEKPTPKKLRDARKEGNVPKSRDLSQTVTTFVWTLILAGLSGLFADRIGSLAERSWIEIESVSPKAMADLGLFALETLLTLIVLPLVAVSAVGVLTEFLQTGPVLALKKITPQGSHLNPASGLQRMFSVDNVYEAFKSIAKTAVLIGIVVILFLKHLDDALKLPFDDVLAYAELEHHLTLQLCYQVVAVFAFLSIIDWLYQKYSHRKKLQMSKYDIRQEHKQQEGDPQIKGKRKQLHRQWASQNAQQAVRESSALVVNPTHIAVALYYHPEETVVPILTAKGEGPLAALMREAAEEDDVPIMRNVPLARALNYQGDEEDFVPEDLFEAVAEVLAWAEQVKRQKQAGANVDTYREPQA